MAVRCGELQRELVCVFVWSLIAVNAAPRRACPRIQRMVHVPSLLWDVAVIGRQVSSPGGQAATGVPVSCLRPDLLRAAGGYRAAEFLAFAEAIENPGAAPPRSADMAIYYTSDYAVFSRPAYRASIRMIGARVAGGECINGEGTKSLHMADGVTCE